MYVCTYESSLCEILTFLRVSILFPAFWQLISIHYSAFYVEGEWLAAPFIINDPSPKYVLYKYFYVHAYKIVVVVAVIVAIGIIVFGAKIEL